MHIRCTNIHIFIAYPSIIQVDQTIKTNFLFIFIFYSNIYFLQLFDVNFLLRRKIVK